jgi:hypothetical protein
VALSADGNTALVGAPRDNNDAGAVWVFTRSGSAWAQGSKLTGKEETGEGWFGSSVALSADGETALVGGPQDNSDAGAVWVFTSSGSAWAQQGEKLVGDCTSSCANKGTGEAGTGQFGYTVALSGDGNTALVGGPQDNDWQGAAWVFTRSDETWTQQGAKLTGKEEAAQGNFGTSAVLSQDGSTALIGAGLIDGIGTSEAAAWVFARSGSIWAQQGAKLTGTGEVGEGHFGLGVALSADGNTALIGGPWDNSYAGAAWVFTRSGETWTQQGSKLTGPGQTGGGELGYSVALSADGNTALVGGPRDNGWQGSAWVFTRSGSTWTQQGAKLTGAGEVGEAQFGTSVALSADGNTALIGGPRDNGSDGAAWVFTRSGETWTRQGSKLTGTGGGFFGKSVALSEDGNTALIGGPISGGVGAAWVFTRSGSAWAQQGEKIVGDCTSSCANEGTGEGGTGSFGSSVALSGNGETALIGGSGDSEDRGAAWVFTRSGEAWTQQGSKLTGTGEIEEGYFGTSVALSADGGTALIGGPYDNRLVGAAWVFARSGSTWAQQGEKLTGTGADETRMFGTSVALSGDGDTALIGEPWDNNLAGAAWEFTRSGSSWTRQDSKLTSADEIGSGEFGAGVALSADGSTALVGGPHDNGGAGAVWAYVFLQISVPSELSFGSQTAGQPGPVLWLSVQNTGQTPLTFNGEAQIGGSDAGDFTIPSGDDLCENTTLEPGQSCRIGVQFTAAAGGARSATLSFDTGNANFAAPTVSLTGTGVAPSSAPAGGGNATSGTSGAQSSAGSIGSTVPQGSTVPPGLTGSPGQAGKVELVTCKPVKGEQRCTAKLVSGTIELETARLTTRARLSRKGHVVATGTVRTVDGHVEFVSNDPRILSPGRYTLTITRKTGRHITETREAITIA